MSFLIVNLTQSWRFGSHSESMGFFKPPWNSVWARKRRLRASCNGWRAPDWALEGRRVLNGCVEDGHRRAVAAATIGLAPPALASLQKECLCADYRKNLSPCVRNLYMYVILRFMRASAFRRLFPILFTCAATQHSRSITRNSLSLTFAVRAKWSCRPRPLRLPFRKGK